MLHTTTIYNRLVGSTLNYILMSINASSASEQQMQQKFSRLHRFLQLRPSARCCEVDQTRTPMSWCRGGVDLSPITVALRWVARQWEGGLKEVWF